MALKPAHRKETARNTLLFSEMTAKVREEIFLNPFPGPEGCYRDHPPEVRPEDV